MIDYSAKLAEYIAGLEYENIPEKIIHRAKLALLDWLACVYRAQGAPAIEAMLAVIRAEGGRPLAPILGYGEKTSLLNATLLHGCMSHTPESDDIFKNASYHPGVSGISAAFTLAQAYHCSGRQLLAAIVGSYEVGTRIALCVMPSHSRYWHPSATVGSMGAAVAAARLLALSPGEIRHALGLAATQAAGLWAPVQGEGAISKPIHAGKAAYNGVLSALMAQQGLRAGAGALNGPRGFAEAMSEDAQLGQLIEGLGQQYNMSQVMVKFYPNCAHMHSALDALVYLRDYHHISAQEIAAINVEIYETAYRLTAAKPRDAFDAKFSLPLALAALLCRGQINFDLFREETLADLDLQAMMEKISVAASPELEADFPRKRRSRLRIRLKNGQELCREEEYRKGDPEKPLTEQEFREKFQTHVAGRLSPSAAERLWQAVMSIETVEDMALLLEE